MGSAEIFPEKFAMYFANMNSLSSKIFQDVQSAAEKSGLSGNLPYNEKCAVLDKCLIGDVLEKSKNAAAKASSNNGLRNGSTNNKLKGKTEMVTQMPKSIVDSTSQQLDDEQVSYLLRAVYPKKPEKYVFEENGVWIDEHSQPFSFCKQSQAKYCRLAELVNNLPVPPTSAQVQPAINLSFKKSHEQQYADSDLDEPDEAAVDLGCENGSVQKSELEKQTKKTNASAKVGRAPSFFGVNVMGFNSAAENSSKSATMGTATKISAQEIPDKKAHAEELTADDDKNDENLPKQKQNLDLIAELQAKLKKTNSGGKAGLGHVQPSKVNKPKAPPPPPPTAVVSGSETPKVAAVAEKSLPIPEPKTTPALPLPKTKTESKEKETPKGKGSDASGDDKKPLSMTKSPLLSSLKKSSASPPPTTATTANSGKEQEFCVDVSSPCRIATPKTGLDFLDNW